ncbi:MULTISPECIES: DUF1611 domain-containing protein [Brevibacterium]|uniref:DUF1611 domain-containing protein n=1 Tax=Brevibacterium TaxID=1696 RepID=UPI0021AACC6A|nr:MULTISPECIES: DUF1611 domain-containing protein [Brevibacterium]MCT1691770.1 DUF1611 domain-containing protein [Brevibacterium sp. p3-SID960]MCT1828759.1 DUF1611 domain-containing protein [Brevibacterium luteolum]
MSLLVTPAQTPATSAAADRSVAAAAPTAAPAAQPLRQRLERAKWAYSTRFAKQFVELSTDVELITDPDYAPQAGDVVLARVLEIGQHKRLESPDSRKALLFPGDEIVVAYGARYAPDQFHAVVPPALSDCHLAAAGGMAAAVIEQHASVDAPTQIQPIGVLRDQSGAITLTRAAHRSVDTGITAVTQRRGHRVPVIAVLGTSMNSGKSTTLACLANGLAAAGLRVAAGKATGTGAGNDARLFADAGAAHVLDFTDFGYCSTFQLSLTEVRDLFLTLVDELAGGPAGSTVDADVVLVEIADGIYQGETAQLLADAEFAGVVDHLVFSAGDALGAVGGVSVLRSLDREPALVSGVVTASPLAAAEARTALDVPVTGTYELCLPEIALSVFDGAGMASAAKAAAGRS